MITGQEQPDGGTLRIGDTVQMAYVDQSRDALDPDKTVWEEISGGDRADQGRRPQDELARLRVVASTSRAPTSSRRSASSPAASATACTWPSCSRRAATCCCSTSRPTTSTSTRCARWRRRCSTSPAARWSSPTIAGSWIASPRTCSPSRATRRSRWFEGNFEAYEEHRHAQLGDEADRPAPHHLQEAHAHLARGATACRRALLGRGPALGRLALARARGLLRRLAALLGRVAVDDAVLDRVARRTQIGDRGLRERLGALAPLCPAVADARALATFLRTPRARSWSKRSSFRLLLAMRSCCPARPGTNHELDPGDHRAEMRDRRLQLCVRQVGRRPEPQPRAAAVGEHAALGERPLELAGARRAQREEAAEALQRNGALARDDLLRARRARRSPRRAGRPGGGRTRAGARGSGPAARRTRTRARRGSGSSGRTSSRRSARPRGRRERATGRARRRARRTPRTSRSRPGRRSSACARQAQEAVALAELQVLVAAADHPRRARARGRGGRTGRSPSAW